MAKKSATRATAAKKGTRRKISKAELAKRIQSDPTRLRKATSGAMAGLMADVAAKDGGILATTVDEAWKLGIGLPLPAFCLEYLFDNIVLPLEKVIGIRGLPKTKKSGLGFEMYRWLRTFCGGVGSLLEHESKFHPSWAASIIGYEDVKSLGYIECASIDQWQKHLQTITTLMKKRMTGTQNDPGLGTGFPFMAIVDSIMGKSTQETQDKIEKRGSLTRNFPAEALNIKNFMQAFPQKLVGWPFLLVFINHLKPSTNDQGITIDNMPGGYGPQFQLSFDIKVRRVKDIHLARVDGTTLMLELMYSSYGQDRRKFPVDCVWWTEKVHDPISGAPYRQKTVWNWHKATVEMMLKTLSDDPRAKEARKLIGLMESSGKRCYAPKLGVPKTSPIKFEQMGVKIKKHRLTMAAWREIFGIKQCKVFRPAVDYAAQKKAAEMAHVEDVYSMSDEEDRNDEEA